MRRIQRKRSPGWRMPSDAIYVGRPTRWGNPWSLEDPQIGTQPDGTPWEPADIVRFYRGYARSAATDPAWLEPLRRYDALACWCALDEPCHADVLLRLLAEVEA